ncbi:MAG: HIRAN domain-containing protein [Firmicutes bacterium]|nr:HIRAN domain-containing protein [Bacillota bacterium]
MAEHYEIEVRKDDMVALVSGKGVADAVKPLLQEIHLFDSFVAGTMSLKDPSVLDALTEGDKLSLRREVNKFDENAIALLSPSGEKIGYVPEMDNVIFARLMDAGKVLSARIDSIDRKGSFSQIRIGIYLVDF